MHTYTRMYMHMLHHLFRQHANTAVGVEGIKGEPQIIFEQGSSFYSKTVLKL